MRSVWRSSVVIAMIAVMISACARPAIAPRPLTRTLAPSGKLRVGVYPDNPLATLRAQSANEGAGVLHDLSLLIGQELANRLRVDLELVTFASQPPVFDALTSGAIDIMLVNATPDRAQAVDFGPDLFQTEQGFFVLADSPLMTPSDVDRSNVRVGVSEGSSSSRILPATLRNAVVIPVPTIKAAVEMLSRHELDTFATNKAVLCALSDYVPGSKVLAGRYGVEHLAIGIPQGRDGGVAYLKQFVDDLKSTGFADRAARRVRLRGTVSAGGQC